MGKKARTLILGSGIFACGLALGMFIKPSASPPVPKASSSPKEVAATDVAKPPGPLPVSPLPVSPLEDRSYQFIQGSKTLTVAVDPTYFPMEYQDDAGILQGFDIEYAKKLAETMGLRASIKPHDLHRAINKLLRREVDAVISAVEVTAPTQAYLEFIPYFQMPQIALVPKGSKFELDPLTGVVGVMTESTVREQLQDLLKSGKAEKGQFQVRGYETLKALEEALVKGDVDGAIVNMPFEHSMSAERKARFDILPAPGFSQMMGIALHPLDRRLKQDLEKAHEKLLDNGVYGELVKEWFGKKVSRTTASEE